MSPEFFSTVLGIIISIVALFVPAYQSLSGDKKRLIMAGAALLVGAGIFGLACLSLSLPWKPTVTCDVDGAGAILMLAIANLGGSQTAFYGNRVLDWLKPLIAGWLSRKDVPQ